jgi:carboxyl-terminal processing protease
MPDVQRNLQENKADVVEMLTLEILKRYYYQKGVIQYSLRDDKDLKIALKVLGNSELYDSILKIKK